MKLSNLEFSLSKNGENKPSIKITEKPDPRIDFAKLSLPETLSPVEQRQLESLDHSMHVELPENARTLAQRISMRPELHEQLLPKLFDQNQLQAELEHHFPNLINGLSTTQLRFAVVLGEPQGELQRGLGGVEFERSADALVAVGNYLNKGGAFLWQKSEQQLFDELTELALGTTNSEQLGASRTLRERRSFRLGFLRLIEAIQDIRAAAPSLLHDQKKAFQDLLDRNESNVKIDGEVAIEVLPYAVVVYLTINDVQKLNSNAGGFFPLHIDEPSELKNKIVIVGRNEDSVTEHYVRRHELKHYFFHHFFERHYFERDIVISQLNHLRFAPPKGFEEEFKIHQALASHLRDCLFETARNEIIAYEGERRSEKHTPFSRAFEDKSFPNAMQLISSHLRRRSDLNEQERSEIAKLYRDHYREFKAWLTDLRYMTRILYERADAKNDPAQIAKLEAFLYMCDAKDLKLMCQRYLGFTPREIEEGRNQLTSSISRDLKEHATRLKPASREIDRLCGFFEKWPTIFKKVDRFLRPHDKALEESIRQVHALQTDVSFLPDLTNIVKFRSHSSITAAALFAIDGILIDCGHKASPEVLSELRDVIDQRSKQPTEKETKELEFLKYLIFRIDSNLGRNVAAFYSTPVEDRYYTTIACKAGQQPAASKIAAAASTLPNDKEYVHLWKDLLDSISFAILDMGKELPTLADINNRCPDEKIKKLAGKLLTKHLVYGR